MTKEEALAILPGSPVEWSDDPDVPYLLLRKSPRCKQLVIQEMITGEEFSIPYSEVKRTSLIRAGSLVKGIMRETGDVIVGLLDNDYWPQMNGGSYLTNCINLRTGRFTKKGDPKIEHLFIATNDEKKEYCVNLLRLREESLQKKKKHNPF